MLTRAERLAGPGRCAVVLDGSADASAEFEWFAGANDGALAGDELLADALQAWGKVVDDPAVLAWWQEARKDGKPALPVQALRLAPVGVARIDLTQDGWVQGDAGSMPVLLYCDMAEGSGPRGIGGGIDLIAMDAADRTQWQRRTNLTSVLPCDAIVGQIDLNWQLRLFEFPLDWLAAGMPPDSLCVLDWTGAPARELLRLIDGGDLIVVCDSHKAGRKLRRRVRPPRPPLQIVVERPIWRKGDAA